MTEQPTTETNAPVEPRTYTVSELKMFIDAVEFLHDSPTDFVPNARQWSRLRDMIMNLSSNTTAVQQVRRGAAVQPVQPAHVPTLTEVVYDDQPVMPAMPAVPAGPSAFGGVPVGPVSMPMATSPVFNGTAGMPSRTPTIDTSNGASYQSSFA